MEHEATHMPLFLLFAQQFASSLRALVVGSVPKGERVAFGLFPAVEVSA